MNPEKRLSKNTPQELTEALVFPIAHTKTLNREASEQLAEARKMGLQEMSENNRLVLEILQSKLKSDD